jgi:hypothetical protein
MHKFGFALLLSSAVTCNAQPVQADPFDKLFAVVSSSKVLATPFPALVKQLTGVCHFKRAPGKNDYNEGKVECVKETTVTDFSATPTGGDPVFMVTMELKGTSKCAAMRAALARQYGKPKESKGPCFASWRMKPGPYDAGRSVGIEPGDGDTVHFTIAEEQGP